MKFQKPKRNTPIVTLIMNYVNKKSGKVSVSREEIKWRFDHLDWKDQKKILIAFLDSGISDREWAYSKMLDNWDESFLPKIKELWETYHEYKCSWSVIRYFPLEYIKEHIEEFTDERDYFFICLRLAKDKDYTIDLSKLSKRDYLAVLWLQTAPSQTMKPTTHFSASYTTAVLPTPLYRGSNESEKAVTTM